MEINRDICPDKNIQNESVLKGCVSRIGPVNKDMYPVAVLRAPKAGRDSRVGPLFSFKDGWLLTRLRLVSPGGDRSGRDWDLRSQFSD